ncbi:MAG: toll/interleukin-1 receptor domain-containing protein [Lachnospiraceae bacterium]|nr:toll/interleukin-1 receptor domain-containing protein [Lachnospiraceae bacterium]
MTNQVQNQKTKQPLRIFISYGHTEHPLCRRIADALRERGHEVWFDQDQLHEGVNWRREIAEGLRCSNGVVACLSDHYVRSRSVCLDELNIVIGVKGGEHIYTILLGDEKIIPATLSHNQWLDMRDWEERLSGNPEAFEEWFGGCMSKLFRILETPDNRVFSGEIQTLQELLQVFPNTSRQSALLKKPFVGREWLTRYLEDWLNDENAERVLFLCGSPGVGKSAFAAHYTHYNPRVAAAIFCRAKEQQFNDPRSILKMLSYLLACRVPDYRKSLLTRLGVFEETDVGPEQEPEKLMPGQVQEKLSSDRQPGRGSHGRLNGPVMFGACNERELFRILFEEPLANLIDGGRERVCLVIDGLDEAGTADKNPLAETLGTYLPMLPSWLRVLVTGRPVPALIQNLGQNQLLRKRNLDGMMGDNLADVRMYFSKMLNDSFQTEARRKRSSEFREQLPMQTILTDSANITDLRAALSGNDDQASIVRSDLEAALDELTLRSRGIFLYAELVCQGILEGRLSLADSEKFPDGLQNSFNSWFQWFFPDLEDFEDQFEPAFGILCAAEEPLPTEELRRIFHWKEKQLRRFFRRIEVLLEYGENVFGKETVTFSHFYIIEWLTDYEKNRLYYVSAEDAKETMADAFLSQLRQSPDDMTEFEACYLLQLLDECGRKKELAEAVAGSHLFRKNTESGKFCREWGHLDKARFYFYRAFLAAEARENRLTDSEARNHYCAACDRIGRLEAVRGNTTEAAKWYQKELDIARRLAAACSIPGVSESPGEPGIASDAEVSRESDTVAVVETPEVLHDLITIHERQAYFHRRLGEQQTAMAHLEEARVFAERLAAVSETPASWREMEDCYVRLGNLSQERGDLNSAGRWFDQAFAIARRLEASQSAAIYLRDLGICYDRMARLTQERGDLAEAEEWFMKALAVTKRLVAVNETAEPMRDLSVCYLKLGDLSRERRDYPKAREWFEKVLEIREPHAKKRGMPKDQRDVASVYLRIGDTALDAGDPAEARKWFEKALVIAEHLVNIRCTWQDRQDQAAIRERLGR